MNILWACLHLYMPFSQYSLDSVQRETEVSNEPTESLWLQCRFNTWFLFPLTTYLTNEWKFYKSAFTRKTLPSVNVHLILCGVKPKQQTNQMTESLWLWFRFRNFFFPLAIFLNDGWRFYENVFRPYAPFSQCLCNNVRCETKPK